MSAKQSSAERVEALVGEPLAGLGLDVEAVEITPAGKRRVLRVAVDRDGGIDLDDIAAATREIGEVLDGSDVMGEMAYTLEVTSRGVDRPLTLPRHWHRNRTRLVKISQVEGDDVVGRIGDSDDQGVSLEISGTDRRIAYADISRAVVQVEFNRSKAGSDTEAEEED